MAATTTKGLWSIKGNDFIKGAYYACIGGVVLYGSFVIEMLLQNEPRMPTWVESLPYIKGIVAAFFGYVIGKLGINNTGKIGQKDEATVHVSVNDLKELKNKAAGNEVVG